MESGIEAADLEARVIIETRTGYRWADIIGRPESEISNDVQRLIQEDIQRRQAGEPVSRIYGQREFWGLQFKISSDTLDPRPDTETLVEAVLSKYKSNPPWRILDLGTGTGCVLIALLTEFPQARGLGIDCSEAALEIARKNAVTNDVAERAEFTSGFWLDGIADQFDLIVSNPPYISNQEIKTLSKEVKNHDPILALEGGEDGLEAYKSIFSDLSACLKPDGKAFFEIGYNQADDVMRLSKESRFSVEGVYRDLAGRARVVEISCGDK